MYTIIFTMHNVYDKYKCGTREWHIWNTFDIDRIPPYFHIEFTPTVYTPWFVAAVEHK